MSDSSDHDAATKPFVGYSSVYRKVEIASITIFSSLMVVLGVKLAPHVRAHPALLAVAFLAGYIAADFACGFFHWGADTWGTSRTILVGNPLIRPFREHHVDSKGMTRHDFVETNGTNCFTAMPGFAIPLLVTLEPGAWFRTRLFVVAFFASLLLWAMATNQIHKWAHTDHPPRVVVLLQRLHLILPPKHHSIHHAAPHTTYYCITNGWMNWLLTQTRFFRVLEWMIAGGLGWIPRQEDPRSGDAD